MHWSNCCHCYHLFINYGDAVITISEALGQIVQTDDINSGGMPAQVFLKLIAAAGGKVGMKVGTAAESDIALQLQGA